MPIHVRTAVLALVAGLVAVVSAAPVAAADDRHGGTLDKAKTDTYVSDYLHRYNLPGASVAVVKNGQAKHQAGFGRTADGKRITAQTPMALGSVSKSFTAFAVLQLVDKGKVDLDHPVVSYLPDFAVDDPRGSRITVRQLLSHTSGLPNPMLVPPAKSLAQAAARTHKWQLSSDPGTRYSYANTNYWLAARLVEVVSKEPFSRYLDAHVFAPLGMTHTVNIGDNTTDHAKGLADGYITAYRIPLRLPAMDQFLGGAGRVVSTAHDMALWLEMQTNHGKTADGTRLLSPALLDESHTPQKNAGHYGLGWSRSSSAISPPRISHSGEDSRYSAQQDLVPSSGYGVVVLQNSFTVTFEHNYEISSGIIDITEGEKPAPRSSYLTFVDFVLGLLTLGVLVAATFGVRRSRIWASRRARWSGWRFGLRLLPQLVAPALAVLYFFVTLTINDNAATSLDAFSLWPAAAILLLALALMGALLTTIRLVRRVNPDSTSAAPTRTTHAT